MNYSQGKLIQKYLNNTLSQTEHDQLIDWFVHLPDHEAAAVFEDLGDEIDQLDEEKLLLLEHKLLDASRNKKDSKPKPFIKISPIIYRIAASVLIIFALALWLTDTLKTDPAKSYTNNFAEKKNNKNQKARLTLPDGTEVWLNASSEIRFPKEFNKNKRDVYLEGEAFFKVAHDAKRPFTVHAPSGLYARVLGTSFNVKAYVSQKDITVAVVTGRVAVGKGKKLFKKLEKGEQITFDKTTATVEEKPAPVNVTNAWIKKELSFNGNTLKEVASILERTYGINIEFTNTVNQSLRCKGSFNLNQQPYEIIQVLCSLHNLQYSSGTNKIIIRKE